MTEEVSNIYINSEGKEVVITNIELLDNEVVKFLRDGLECSATTSRFNAIYTELLG